MGHLAFPESRNPSKSCISFLFCAKIPSSARLSHYKPERFSTIKSYTDFTKTFTHKTYDSKTLFIKGLGT